MPLIVRPLRSDEGRAFLDIHSRAIRGLAAQHYSPDVIAAWAGRVTDARVEEFSRNPRNETRVIAELNGECVGLGVVDLDNCVVIACYVVPEVARQGVGSAVIREFERIARQRGLTRLDLESSINAEPFYASLGYEVVTRGERVMPSGHRMASVKMTKSLT